MSKICQRQSLDATIRIQIYLGAILNVCKNLDDDLQTEIASMIDKMSFRTALIVKDMTLFGIDGIEKFIPVIGEED